MSALYRLRLIGLLLGLFLSGAAWSQQTQGATSSVSFTTKDAEGKSVVHQTVFMNPSAVANFIEGLRAEWGDRLVNFNVAGNRRYDGTGAAAAGGGSRWNVWGAASHNRTGNSFQPLQSSGNVTVLMAGVDYRVLDNLLVGLAVTGERSRTNLDYVAGGGNLAGDGYSIAPYLGYVINRALSLDATVGYGTTKYDIAGGGVTGSFRGSRTFGSIGLNYRYEGLGPRWLVTGRAAVLGASTRLGSFTASNGTFVDSGTSDVSQLRLGAQVSYAAGTVNPYVGLTYVYDVSRPGAVTVGGQTSANDRDAWVPAFGLRFSSAGSAYGSLQFSSERGRSQFKNDQLLFNLGVRF